jgi:hypothetical protein
VIVDVEGDFAAPTMKLPQPKRCWIERSALI